MEPLERRDLLAGSGLSGAYYARTNHTLAKFAQTDPAIDFQWTGGTPAKSLGTDGFSVRWDGLVMPKFSEAYKFIVTTSGGVRVWVNNALIIENWNAHSSTEDIGTIGLIGGKQYDIRIDYWSDGNDPSIKLEWESKRRTRELVPANRLFGTALDAIAPTTPTRFRATYVTDNVIKVMWNPSQDSSGVVAYDVYVGSTKVHTTPPGEEFYIRRSLAASTGYQFSVQAIDAAGNASGMVSTAVVTAPPRNIGPTVPQNVKVTSKSQTSITLSWSASTDDKAVTGYRIYRNGVKLPVGPTGTTFTDTGLQPGVSYSYTVRAADGEGAFSGYSNTASATTDAPASLDPYAGLNAVDYTQASGVSRTGNDLTSLDDNDWIRFDDLDFGSSGADSVELLLSLPASHRGGTIELRLSSPGGTLLGSHTVQPTGSFSTFNAQRFNISKVTGVTDLVVVFKGRSGVANLRSITFSTNRLVQIMPLGDSITQQNTHSNSYRYYLWQMLQNAGHNVDFVGGETEAFNGNPPNWGFDQNHEGHAGYRADEIAANVGNWSTSNRPDIVLLHVGTNDIRQGQSVSSTLDDIGNIIDALRAVNPGVIILLAQIVPTSGWESQINDLNSQIPGLAASKSTGQSPIHVIDHNTGFSITDTQDGIHPNNSGDNKMATRWFSVLDQIL